MSTIPDWLHRDFRVGKGRTNRGRPDNPSELGRVSIDGVPPPEDMVSASNCGIRRAADVGDELTDLALPQTIVMQAAVEITVVADRRAKRNVNVDAGSRFPAPGSRVLMPAFPTGPI